MLHPATELRFVSPQIGFGVFATALIPKGTLTWVRCKLDRSFTADDVRTMGTAYDAVMAKYSYTDGGGKLVLCWDSARYMNHSCDPACISPGFDCDVAVRDIAAGEELTCDYGTLNPSDALVCACGSPVCRGKSGPGDGVAFAQAWDTAVAAAFVGAEKLEQPLLEFTDEREQMARGLRGECAVPSIRRHLRYGKERPAAVRLEPFAGSFRVIAAQPLEPGQPVLCCEGPDTNEGPFAEDELALAVTIAGRGLVVPHNEVRFIRKSSTPNAVLERDGTVQATRGIAPGEEITLPVARA